MKECGEVGQCVDDRRGENESHLDVSRKRAVQRKRIESNGNERVEIEFLMGYGKECWSVVAEENPRAGKRSADTRARVGL